MSLRQIIKKREAYVDSMLDRFSAEFNSFSRDIQNEIVRVFRSGDFNREQLVSIFVNNGFPEQVQDWADRHIEVLKFNSQMAKELGTKFVFSEDNIQMFDAIQTLTESQLSDSMLTYVNELQRFGIQSQLERRTMGDITNFVAESITGFERRLMTEAYTGVSMAINSSDLALYKEAGIDKFVYMGPRDGKTRDACLSTLDDPRQETGWTASEVADSGTPFIVCGGWNCRHRWMAYTGDM